jgi:hypothetical protein
MNKTLTSKRKKRDIYSYRFDHARIDIIKKYALSIPHIAFCQYLEINFSTYNGINMLD